MLFSLRKTTDVQLLLKQWTGCVLVHQRNVLSPVHPLDGDISIGHSRMALASPASSVWSASTVPTSAHIHVLDSGVLDRIRVNLL